MSNATHSHASPTDTQTMKQLGIVILGLVGVTLGLIIAVSIIA